MPAIITSPAAKAKPPPKEAPSNLRPGFLVGGVAAVEVDVIGSVFVVPPFIVGLLVPVVMAALLVG
jgi:hypothetical protein